MRIDSQSARSIRRSRRLFRLGRRVRCRGQGKRQPIRWRYELAAGKQQTGCAGTSGGRRRRILIISRYHLKREGGGEWRMVLVPIRGMLFPAHPSIRFDLNHFCPRTRSAFETETQSTFSFFINNILYGFTFGFGHRQLSNFLEVVGIEVKVNVVNDVPSYMLVVPIYTIFRPEEPGSVCVKPQLTMSFLDEKFGSTACNNGHRNRQVQGRCICEFR